MIMTAPARDLQELRHRLESRFGRAILPLPGEGAAPGGGLRTGVRALDRLLPQGIPRGALTLWTGEPSSGRTAALRALVARACAAGERVALVDASGTLAPAFALREGEPLPGLCVVRPPPGGSRHDGGRAAEALLRTGIFALVVLDGVLPSPPAALRLRALAREQGAALVIAAEGRGGEGRADLRVEFRGVRGGGEGLAADGRISRRARVRAHGGGLPGAEEEVELAHLPPARLGTGALPPDRSAGG